VPIIRELSPHLDEVVVIGGWVPELHRRFGPEGDWAVRPLRSVEVDVLLSGSAGAQSIGLTLQKGGFIPVGPEPSAVWERDVAAGERIEFFVDHEGPWKTLSTVSSLGPDRRWLLSVWKGWECLHRSRRRLPFLLASLVSHPWSHTSGFLNSARF
jgi:hypothetical protein